MPITELVVLTLKPDAHIGDPDNHASTVLDETCKTLTGRDGCLQVHFATVVEDSSKLRLFIDWQTLEKHQEFMASEAYKPFKSNIISICSAPPNVVHVKFEPAGALDIILAAPCTELVTFYFDGGVPDEYLEGVAGIASDIEGVPDVKGVAWGATHEKVDHDGVSGTAAVLAIGWTSKEHHMQFRRTDQFKQMGPSIRGSSKGAQMQHMKALKYIA